MADVVLSTDDIVVLSGPASVTVTTDFGAAGQRGSLMFTGLGAPTIAGNITQTVQLLDTYINTLSTDPDGKYKWLYQYQNVNGTPTWVPLFSLEAGA